MENGLCGLISLPSGVFNPYSGVKTSILIIDKSKNKDFINFYKLDNDGYSLGSKRTPVVENDIPELLIDIKGKSNLAEKVSKKIISENEYSLNASSYAKSITNTKFELKKLKEVASFQNGFAFKPEDWEKTGKKIIRIQNLNDKSKPYNLTTKNVDSKYLVQRGDLLISWSASIGVYFWENDEALLNQHIFKVNCNNKINKKFLYSLSPYIIEQINMRRHGGTMTHIKKGDFENIEIPLPPLEKQQEIVDEIEQYQKVIDGARQVVDNYKPTFSTKENSKGIEIGELCTLTTGGTPKTGVKDYYNPGIIKWLVSGDIHTTEIFDCEGRISELGMKESNAKFLPENSVLIALNGQGKTRGSVSLLRTKATCNQSLVSIMPNDSEELLSEYLFLCLKNMYMEIRNLTGHKDRRGLNMPIIKKIKIPLVSIEAQKEIVESTFSEIESVRKLDDIISSKNDEINNLINSLYTN